MASKLNQEVLRRAIGNILNPPEGTPRRNFNQTIDLQIGLRDYDPQKDKRFSGNIKLPFLVRPRLQVILLADQEHADQAEALGIPYIDAEGLKRFNRQRKPMKKFFKQYKVLLGSDSVMKQLPRLVGPMLSKLGKFPVSVSHSDNLVDKVNEAKATVKFQLRKVTNLGTAVGHMELELEQIRQNTTLAINFLVSMLKKNWNNVKSLVIKSSMGKPQRIYG